MEITDFRERMLKASRSVHKLTCEYVSNNLPDDYVYLVSDGTERLLIDDLGKAVSIEDALTKIWSDGEIPTWVDMTAVFVRNDKLYILLVLSNTRTSKSQEMVWKDSSIGPFRCKSPALPVGWQPSSPKFDLNRERKFL